MPRLAIATACLSRPLRKSFLAAAQMRADGVRLDIRNELRHRDISETGRRQILHSLSEYGLSIASVVFPTRRALHDETYLEDRVQGLKDAMAFAFQLKAPFLSTRIGRIPEDTDSPEYQTVHDVLSDLAHHGNHVGSCVCIQPTNDEPQRLLQLVESIKTGPVGVDFDPASIAMVGHSPIEAAQTLSEYVWHVVARDGVRDIDGSGLEVPLGRGEVQWDHMIAQLAEQDYRGWLSVDRTQGDDRAGDAERALQYLQRVVME